MLLFVLHTLIYLLLHKINPFALIMITWSIYYEFRNYAKYNFVEEFLPPQKNTDAWSVMSVFQSLAYSLGPILAFLLMSKSVNSALIGSMIIVIMSGITYIAFEKNHPKRKKYQSESQIRAYLKFKNNKHNCKKNMAFSSFYSGINTFRRIFLDSRGFIF
jgi:hypothetical protein